MHIAPTFSFEWNKEVLDLPWLCYKRVCFFVFWFVWLLCLVFMHIAPTFSFEWNKEVLDLPWLCYKRVCFFVFSFLGAHLYGH